MAGIYFTHFTDSKVLARDFLAVLCPDRSVFISADKKHDRIDLGLFNGTGSSSMTFTAEQARSIAAELLACAEARDALRPVEPSLEG